jgi:6,7-dimethyl-8-ribityllumazine synthase
MTGQHGADVGTTLSEIREGSLQIPCVPQDDSRHEQIQARSAVGLVLKAAVAHFAEAIEEDGSRQGIASLALVEGIALKVR